MNLALFDFDGTITTKEMFTDFIHFSISKKRALCGRVLLFPWILLYKLGWYPAYKLRALVAFYAFKGEDYKKINALGASYAENVIPQYLRDHAVAKIRWHQDNGDKVVVVSASLDMYLRHWCTAHNVSLICSVLEVKKLTLSGRFIAGDCSSEAKAQKILAQFTLNDFDKVYAYGDTEEDLAMLALADEQYMNWQLMK